jgi:hypothetical protein
MVSGIASRDARAGRELAAPCWPLICLDNACRAPVSTAVAALEVAAAAVVGVDSQEEEVVVVVAFQGVSQLTCASEVPVNTASDFTQTKLGKGRHKQDLSKCWPDSAAVVVVHLRTSCL